MGANALMCVNKLFSYSLGYQDSNLERMNQNHLCCQLHHTPRYLPPWATSENFTGRRPHIQTERTVTYTTFPTTSSPGPYPRNGLLIQMTEPGTQPTMSVRHSSAS